MRTPDRRSYDSPRRGSRDKGRDDDFPPPRGRAEPFVPYTNDPIGGRPSPFGAPRTVMSGGPETSAVVKWFNATKGFGFIAPDGGKKDVFVHISALERSGLSELKDNQKVTFDIEAGRDGRESAVNLKLA